MVQGTFFTKKHILPTCILLLSAGNACTQMPVSTEYSQQQVPSYQHQGPFAATVEHGTIDSTFGCKIRYEHYLPMLPANKNPPVPVILTHGFMRKLQHMSGWAKHWASWGIATTVVSLCNSNLLNGHHARNAQDLQQVAFARHPEQPVVFAGFSAGGLAAWLAARDYSDAIAYLGLDPVDSGNLAQDSSPRQSLSGLVLYAYPSMCNARNNFLPSAQRQTRFTLEKVTGASHCHFEIPYDQRCAWVCGSAARYHSNQDIQRHLKARTTSWLLTLESLATPQQ